MQGDRKKLQELILYISEQCSSKQYYGKTMLYKLLFFSDFAAYRKLGSSITGIEYQKIEHGPAPLCRDEIMERMEDDGVLAIQARNVGGYEQKKPVNLVLPDLDGFSGPEVAIVTEMITTYGHMTASRVEAISHREPAWFLTKMWDVIPYDLAYISAEPFSQEEEGYARELAKQHLGSQ